MPINYLKLSDTILALSKWESEHKNAMNDYKQLCHNTEDTFSVLNVNRDDNSHIMSVYRIITLNNDNNIIVKHFVFMPYNLKYYHYICHQCNFMYIYMLFNTTLVL